MEFNNYSWRERYYWVQNRCGSHQSGVTNYCASSWSCLDSCRAAILEETHDYIKAFGGKSRPLRFAPQYGSSRKKVGSRGGLDYNVFFLRRLTKTRSVNWSGYVPATGQFRKYRIASEAQSPCANVLADFLNGDLLKIHLPCLIGGICSLRNHMG